jgi:S-DNA-T family DNA segregation ATPase FtsK/SpoIIIE
MKQWITPTMQYYSLYADMLKQTHLLIAGATGSGKSVVINGIITTSLKDSPAQVQYILIDPKRVELVDYKPLPHTIAYASEPDTMVQALQRAMHLIEDRYAIMQRQHVKKYSGSNVYIVIDELADLMTTNKKQVQPLIQRIAQIGRAAKVHIIAATQCPLSAVIPTPIKVNFDSRVGLRTRSRQDSRNILGCGGCELLPSYGQGYYMTAQGIELYKIPMYDQTTTNALIQHWTRQNKPLPFFHRH